MLCWRGNRLAWISILALESNRSASQYPSHVAFGQITYFVSWGSPEKPNQREVLYTHRKRLIAKSSLMQLRRQASPKIYRVSWQAGHLGRTSISVQRLAGGIFSYLGEGQPFLFHSGLLMMRLTCIGRALCFFQSIDSNICLMPKHHHRNTQNNIWVPHTSPSRHMQLTITL